MAWCWGRDSILKLQLDCRALIHAWKVSSPRILSILSNSARAVCQTVACFQAVPYVRFGKVRHIFSETAISPKATTRALPVVRRARYRVDVSNQKCYLPYVP